MSHAIHDSRFKAQAQAAEAKPLSLGADAMELASVAALWNMIAPRGHAIDVDRLARGLGGFEPMQRVNALMHSLRQERSAAAVLAARKCLEIVRDSTSATEAAQRIARIIEPQVKPSSLVAQESDREDVQ